jgi:hypothetical protein
VLSNEWWVTEGKLIGNSLLLNLSTQHSTLSTSWWRRGWEFEVVLARSSRTPAEGASPLAGSP